MSLKHILLGMLEEPASGYDIKNEFNQSLAHFWAAELSQIYPLLARMEREGLLKSQTVASDKGPPRKIYRRTKSGQHQLIEWLTEGPQLNEERRHYLAQAFFLGALSDNTEALQFIEEFRDRTEEKLTNLKAADKQWRNSVDGYPDELGDSAFYKQMTLDFGMRVYRAHLQWCRVHIERIKRTRN